MEAVGGSLEAKLDKDSPSPLGDADVVEWWWCSSGGYGDPLYRTPQLVADDVRQGYVSEAMARETYGVVLDGQGGVDDAATDERRREVRAGRLERASAPAGGDGGGQGGASVDGRIGDRIRIASGRAQCAACDHDLGSSDANLKDQLAVEESPVSDAGPLFSDPAPYIDDERIRLLRYHCPGCAAQLSVTVEHAGEEALSEYEIRA